MLYLCCVHIDLIGGLIRAKTSEPHLDMKYVRHDWVSYSKFFPNSRKPVRTDNSNVTVGPVQNQALPKFSSTLVLKL